ncbi:hypothetical protein [Shimazuella kribbensis]|uniref:deoxynucleotide monophosphate kinase family protein n=1 Tax=Shimazuella kribbensis TaxID=139808 RepID=UPI00048A624C|nr:hypothetical protein [Shimazuella kribbensis]
MDYRNIVDEILCNYEDVDRLNTSLKGIALMGKMRSGKDTIAEYVYKYYGFTCYAFGDALKKYVHHYSGIPLDSNKP